MPSVVAFSSTKVSARLQPHKSSLHFLRHKVQVVAGLHEQFENADTLNICNGRSYFLDSALPQQAIYDVLQVIPSTPPPT